MVPTLAWPVAVPRCRRAACGTAKQPGPPLWVVAREQPAMAQQQSLDEATSWVAAATASAAVAAGAVAAAGAAVDAGAAAAETVRGRRGGSRGPERHSPKRLVPERTPERAQDAVPRLPTPPAPCRDNSNTRLVDHRPVALWAQDQLAALHCIRSVGPLVRAARLISRTEVVAWRAERQTQRRGPLANSHRPSRRAPQGACCRRGRGVGWRRLRRQQYPQQQQQQQQQRLQQRLQQPSERPSACSGAYDPPPCYPSCASCGAGVSSWLTSSSFSFPDDDVAVSCQTSSSRLPAFLTNRFWSLYRQPSPHRPAHQLPARLSGQMEARQAQVRPHKTGTSSKTTRPEGLFSCPPRRWHGRPQRPAALCRRWRRGRRFCPSRPRTKRE